MHEYPRNPTFESVRESRVTALGGFGSTQRQREFLVTARVHAGCFLERQYCAFHEYRPRPEQSRVRRRQCSLPPRARTI
jgi:hypothetical protein